MPRDIRVIFRFALFWRLATAMLLIGCLACYCLLATGFIELSEQSEFDFLARIYLRGPLRAALATLLLIVALRSVPSITETHRSRSSNIIHWIGCVRALVVLFLVAVELHLIPFLVTIAVLGIEMAAPLQQAITGVSSDVVARLNHFFLMSSVAAAGTFVGIAFVPAWVRALVARQRRRFVWAALVATGCAFGATYLDWLYAGGLYQALPDFAMTIAMRPLDILITSAAVLLVLVTAGTCRLLERSGAERRQQSIDRRRPAGYYHEKAWVPLILVGGFSVHVVQAPHDPYMNRLSLLELVESFLSWPPYCLHTIVFVAAVFRLIAISRNGGTATSDILVVRPAHFVAVWLVTLSTSIIVAGTFIWFSFAVWFSPWSTLSWP